MREDPTISYRAIAKVLDLSDQTVRRWRDEEGIPIRPHRNSRPSRNGAPGSWRPPRARASVAPEFDRDDDRYQDDEEDERPWVEDLEDGDDDDKEEELELDAVPVGSHAADLAHTWETLGHLGGLRFGSTATQRRASGSARPGAVTPPPRTPAYPGTRLRAITSELEATRLRGPAATKLLVEAACWSSA